MASPTKRRKKNGGTATPLTGVRSLDFFFGKNRQQQQLQLNKTEGNVTPPNPHADGTAATSQQTDEYLARKLHEEWNGTGESSSAVGSKTGAMKDVVGRGEERVGSMGIEGASAVSTTREVSTDGGKISLRNSLDSENAVSILPLDQDPLIFNPDTYEFLINSFPNGKATYELLTRGFVLITSTRSRIKIVDTLVNLLRVIIRLDSKSLLPAVWLATNSIGPSYENNELGLGGSILSKAILKISGVSRAALKALNNKHGDPGDVAFEAKTKQRTLMMKKHVPLSMVLGESAMSTTLLTN